MDTPDLLAVCGLAFIVVFALLTLQALVMRLITTVFPERKSTPDAAVVAAISCAVASLHAGARVVEIEEES